ncbi:hypothetical protein BJV77DRAFT_1011586, partial [Russula vinacea]
RSCVHGSAFRPNGHVTMCRLEEARFLVPPCRTTTKEVEIDACTCDVKLAPVVGSKQGPSLSHISVDHSTIITIHDHYMPRIYYITSLYAEKLRLSNVADLRKNQVNLNPSTRRQVLFTFFSQLQLGQAVMAWRHICGMSGRVRSDKSLDDGANRLTSYNVLGAVALKVLLFLSAHSLHFPIRICHNKLHLLGCAISQSVKCSSVTSE